MTRMRLTPEIRDLADRLRADGAHVLCRFDEAYEGGVKLSNRLLTVSEEDAAILEVKPELWRANGGMVLMAAYDKVVPYTLIKCVGQRLNAGAALLDNNRTMIAAGNIETILRQAYCPRATMAGVPTAPLAEPESGIGHQMFDAAIARLTACGLPPIGHPANDRPKKRLRNNAVATTVLECVA